MSLKCLISINGAVLVFLSIMHVISATGMKNLFQNQESVPGDYLNYIEMLFVVDQDLFLHYNKNYNDLEKYLLKVIEAMNKIYLSANIKIALVGTIYWSQYNFIEHNRNMSKNLEDFRIYRQFQLSPTFKHDHAQLIRYKEFDYHDVGVSYRAKMCSEERSVSLIHYHQDVKVASTLHSHELGHSLGLDHGDSGSELTFRKCECNHVKCIMNERPITPIVAANWSSCSLRKLKLIDWQCLRNRPTSVGYIINPQKATNSAKRAQYPVHLAILMTAITIMFCNDLL